MPAIPGGVVLQPIGTETVSVCTPELLAKEDLFLMLAEFFAPYDSDPAGFGHLYGVYDPTVGETPDMCLGADDRAALMRNLWLIYTRLSSALNYHPLPYYVPGELHHTPAKGAMKVNRGYVRSVARRSCTPVTTGTPLLNDPDGMWSITFAMPAGAVLDDLVAYESGARSTRVPIAERSLVSNTATLRFYRETLVSAHTWAECGARRSPCDCSVSISDALDFIDAIDVYWLQPDTSTGIQASGPCDCETHITVTCGILEQPILGWVRAYPHLSCDCLPVETAYSAVSYTSGRWMRNDLPSDIQEAMYGAAVSLLPETSLCREATRPQQFSIYRLAAPTDAPGGMRAFGQVLLRAAVKAYALGKGI